MFQFVLSLFILSVSSLYLNAQAEYPKNDFISPIDIKMYLSGTFGEPRRTHFHTGLDIKTAGVVGKSIYAIADGYVSRVSVSPYGYGNALYITHKNGYTSVYGHLKSFNKTIQNYIGKKQKEEQHFELNIEDIAISELPVYQGEVIAYSGNTGGSGGPHLHFEIRDSLEHPINPLLFGYDKYIIDKAPPSIYNLYVYNVESDQAFSSSKKVSVSKVSVNSYKIYNTILVNRDLVGLGIHTIDLFTNTSNKNGVYKIKLFDNGELIYTMQMDVLSFSLGKHVYTQCDFYLKTMKNNTVYRCYKEPGNRLEIYPKIVDNGILNLSDYEKHAIKIEVSDFMENVSSLEFNIQKDLSGDAFIAKPNSYNTFFELDKRNRIDDSDLKLNFPPYSFFNNTYFSYSKDYSASSTKYIIQDFKTPVSTPYEIGLRMPNTLLYPIEKYIIVYENRYGKIKSIGGKVRDKFLYSKAKDFGSFYITTDTIAPKIYAVNISEGKNISQQSTIQFKGSDNLSGIKSYDLYINGQWAILQYDYKRNLFWYFIDSLCIKGQNELELIVSDACGNISKLKYSFWH